MSFVSIASRMHTGRIFVALIKFLIFLMTKRSNFWNDYPNLESNINSVWDGHKEVRVSLHKLPDKSFRQTLSYIVFKAILMCRRSSVWESVWNAVYIRVRWTHNHKQLHARQACPLSLSHSLAFLSLLARQIWRTVPRLGSQIRGFCSGLQQLFLH